MTNDNRTSILFICLGNICRSPLAEGMFLQLAHDRSVLGQFHIDSAGTGGWHVGDPPDHRMHATARRYKVELVSRARKVDPQTDFPNGSDDGFDWLIPMDLSNRDKLLSLGAPRDRVRLLRSFDPALAGAPDHKLEVPDPYYGGDEGFDRVYHLVRDACQGMLDELAQ